MSADRDRTGPSDQQLADIVRFIARTCLEVERGHRPADQLAHLMHPTAAPQWRPRTRLGRFDGGPVRPRDLGRPHPSRTDDATVLATVITRTQGDHWGALTFRLHLDQARVYLADPRRLLPSTRRTVRSTGEADRTSADRIRLATGDRRLAVAARDATARRLHDLPSGEPGHEATRIMHRHWTAKLAELDRELGDLQAQVRLRHHVPPIARR